MHPSNWIQHLPANTQGRDFVVGDLHGCFSELFLLLQYVQFNFMTDRLFSVGDLIDRGPDSQQALSLLDQPWFFSVRGNHEQMLLDFWDNPRDFEPYDNEWLTRFPAHLIPISELKMKALPFVLHIEGSKHQHDFYIMHAELFQPGQMLTAELIHKALYDPDRAQKQVLWSRHVVTEHLSRNVAKPFHSPSLSPIFCGHTIVDLPTHIEQAYYIDTGAFVPYTDPERQSIEHYGLSLIEIQNKRHFFASTAIQFRGTVIEFNTF